MNTQFIFDNLFYFPLFVVVVLAIYLIQFCSCISPNRIEFDGDSKKEMNIMNRYNAMSESAFSIYLGCSVFTSSFAISSTVEDVSTDFC